MRIALPTSRRAGKMEMILLLAAAPPLAPAFSADPTASLFQKKCKFCLDRVPVPNASIPVSNAACAGAVAYAKELSEGDSACTDLQSLENDCCPGVASMVEVDHADQVDDLTSQWDEYKNVHSKAQAIIASSTAIVSIFSSFVLIWIMGRSPSRFSTTYHQLLLGLSISDIFFSLSFVHFNYMIPKDLNYMVWNARGNQATCTAIGFMALLGGGCSMLYMCSLNIFHVVRVKHYGSDSQILTRTEPFLHGVPILLALIISITGLVEKGYNGDNTGICLNRIYNPPHCVGYEEGEVPEGFTIPCRLGDNLTVDAMGLLSGIVMIATPIIIGICLRIIYRAVTKHERLIQRDLVHSQNAHTSDTTSGDHSSNNDSGRGRIIGGSGNSSSTTGETSSSQARNAVKHRATAYAFSYIFTWIGILIPNTLIQVGVWESTYDIPVAMNYVWVFTNPLQGLCTLSIYMYPRLMSTRAPTRR